MHIDACRVNLDQLVGGPGDGVGFARTCRVLNQIGLTYAVVAGMVYQPAHHIQLMVTGEVQGAFAQQLFG